MRRRARAGGRPDLRRHRRTGGDPPRRGARGYQASPGQDGGRRSDPRRAGAGYVARRGVRQVRRTLIAPESRPRGAGLMPLAFDLHLDLALSAIQLNRDLTLSIEDCRRSEAGLTERMRGHNTVTFPEM